MRFSWLCFLENPLGINTRRVGKGSDSKAFVDSWTPGHSLGVSGEPMVLEAPLPPDSVARLHALADGDSIRGCRRCATDNGGRAVYPLGRGDAKAYESKDSTVTKLFLMIIFGFVAALYFPDSRQMIIDEAMPVLQPVLIWNAEREMEDLSRAVRTQARETYRLPTSREWNSWLDINLSGGGGEDPWGRSYSYQSWPDSFAIQSHGPDGLPGNPDDLRLAKYRPF
jgi:hypothetical protein